MGEARALIAYYVDSSVVVHALLGTPRAEHWFDDVSRHPDVELVTSRLTRTECTRVLRREGRDVVDRDQVLARMSTVPVTDFILAAAESIEAPIRTLDAVHIASAMATGLDPVVVTHDDTMKRVALSLGYAVSDPLTDEPAG